MATSIAGLTRCTEKRRDWLKGSKHAISALLARPEFSPVDRSPHWESEAGEEEEEAIEPETVDSAPTSGGAGASGGGWGVGSGLVGGGAEAACSADAETST